MVEYSLLGETVADGIFAWVSFGVDFTQQYTVQPASTLTENGGVADDSGFGGGSGGPGGPGGNSTAGGAPPSGAVPSGAAPSGVAPAS